MPGTAPLRHLALGLAALAIAGCATTPPADRARTAEPAATAPAAETAPTKPCEPADAARCKPHAGLVVAAVGDVMIGTDFPENILPDDDGVGFFDGVRAVLTRADVTFGNFEGVLLDGGEPVKQCKNPKICFLFRTPVRYAAYLPAAGFTAMSLANNHARDFGEEGRSSSMAALDAAGIVHSGREGTTASWQANGRRVALAAFAPNVGSNQLNEPQMASALVAQLAATHDIVIVSFHGGAEGAGAELLPFAREIFAGEDRGNVVEFARAMVDAGADLVLGHGPHVLRPMELYHDRLIAYSLGNFATYYGISVEGIRGIAPILIAELDPEGRFARGRVESTTQIRPAGPSLDPAQRALNLLRELTSAAFPQGSLIITADGQLATGGTQ